MLEQSVMKAFSLHACSFLFEDEIIDWVCMDKAPTVQYGMVCLGYRGIFVI